MITYLKGDATSPDVKGFKLIVHVCNDVGGWGRGFVLALSKKWPEPEAEYRTLKPAGRLLLGQVQFVNVDDTTIVANMIAQKGYGKNNKNLHRSDEPDDDIPLQYDHLKTCLEKVHLSASIQSGSVHMPRIGCGLAGGSWERVESIITAVMRDVPVYVYNLS